MPPRRKSHLMRLHVSKVCDSLSEKRRCQKLVKSAVARALDEFANGASACCTIREKLNDYLEHRMMGLGQKACNEKTAALHRRRLLAFDQAFHSAPIDSIAKEDVVAWMKRRLNAPRRGGRVSGDTVNADVESLKAFSRWAQENDAAPAVLPLLLTPRIQTGGKVAGTNWRPPQVMDIHNLLDIIDRIKAVRRDIGLFFYGMLFYNLRPSEVADLKRGDLRLPARGRAGTLEARRIKTGGQEVTLPIPEGSERHGWALACLELAKQEGRESVDAAPLIICITGKSRRNPGGWTTDILDQAVERTCRKLGEKIRPYLIRHSIVSYLHNHTDLPSGSVSAHAGHAKETTTNIYSHRAVKDAIPAFAEVEKVVLARKQQTG